MKKHFYHHLVDIEMLSIKLDELSLSKIEKEHLLHLAHGSIHQAVMTRALSHIPEHDRKMFLSILEEDDHDKTWEFLNKRTVNLEAKMKKDIKNVLLEFKKDIEELKDK